MLLFGEDRPYVSAQIQRHHHVNGRSIVTITWAGPDGSELTGWVRDLNFPPATVAGVR